MTRKNSRSAAAFLAASALAGLLIPLLAPQPAQAATRSVAAVDGIALRAAPKAEARVLRRLPILTEVIILNRAERRATIDGREDAWVYVQANYCPDKADKSLACETVYQNGWVAHSKLAYGARFEPLSDWRLGRIEVPGRYKSWSYAFDAQGGFTYERESWSYVTKGFSCRAEQRGRYCVEQRLESGQLYRYGDVVRAGRDGELLYIDGRGALCDRMSTPGAPYCDR